MVDRNDVAFYFMNLLVLAMASGILFVIGMILSLTV